MTRTPNGTQAARLTPRSWARRRAFTMLELVVALVVLAILAALAIPSGAATIRSSKVSSVAAAAHGIDHQATAAAALDRLPSNAVDPASPTHATFLSEALAAMPASSPYTISAPGLDGYSYSVSNPTWTISVCLVTSPTPGVYGTVTATGGCSGVHGSLLELVAAVERDAVARASAHGAVPSSVDPSTGLTYFQEALNADYPSGRFTATLGADGKSYTVTDTNTSTSVCDTTSSTVGSTGAITTGACTGMKAPLTTLLAQLDASAAAAAAAAGKTPSSIDVATGKTYFQDAIDALTGGSSLVAVIGADGKSFTVTDLLTSTAECLTTSTVVGHTGTLVSGACTGLAAPGLAPAPAGVSTYAGNGTNATANNASRLLASLANPDAIAVAPDGTMYVGEGSTATTTGAYKIEQISPSGAVTTLVGDGTAGWSTAGGAYNPSTVLPLSSARVGRVQGLTYSAGKLYVAEGAPNASGGAVGGLCNSKPTVAAGLVCGIRVIDLAAGTIQGFVGNGSQPAAQWCSNPAAFTGCLNTVQAPLPGTAYTNWDTQTISAWAASKTPLTADVGPIYGVAVAPNGDVYFTQAASGCLLHVTAGGTLVFDTCFPFPTSGQVIANQVAIDGSGTVYAITYEGVYRWVPSTSTLSHWGTTASCAVATANPCNPSGIQVSSDGSKIWYSNSNGDTIAVLTVNATTFSSSTSAILAGIPGTAGSLDTAPATSSTFSGLIGQEYYDSTNNTLYVADANSYKVRQMPAS